MKSSKDIAFLTKPNINAANFEYIFNMKKVYVNLFEIKMKKKFILYQYPYFVNPPIEAEDLLIRDKLFKCSNKKLKDIFDDCFISGDSLYSMKEIKVNNNVKCALFFYGMKEYTIEFSNFRNKRTIEPEDIQRDPLSKKFIEIIIKDILASNPKLEFYKDVFVIKHRKKTIVTNKCSLKFYPGFKTSFVETDSGNYLNITLKNKVIQYESINDFINQYKKKYRWNIKDEIKSDLRGRLFKVCYSKKNYKIDDILFDRTPRNQTINYEGKSINLIKYYEKVHHLKIKDEKQPLILVKKKDSKGEPNTLYFIPEFCTLSELDYNVIFDRPLMKELEKYTKLDPENRVNNINEFIKLISDKNAYQNCLSPKEKCELYGIEIEPINNLFDAYYMKEPKLLGENSKEIHSNDRIFPILDKKDMTNWVCFYEKNNYDDAQDLFENLNKASKAFRLKIDEPEYIEMENRSSAKDWTDIAGDYFGSNKNDYFFVVFLLGRNDKIYAELKRNSLCENGYISQVIRVQSIKKRV